MMNRGFANQNVADQVSPAELDEIETEIAGHVEAILRALRIDVRRDPNTQRTPERVAKMYVREVFSGRFEPAPSLVDFPNGQNLDELYTVGPITIRSCCAHHLCPIEGEAWCGIIPSRRLIGLSKFSRLANWVLARPQIQEDACVQIANEIEDAIQPLGLGVVIRARHTCLSWRGVKDSATSMATSVLRGALRDKPEARAEFLAMIGAQGFSCRG